MTEMDRMRIVENMFPDWWEHLSDGKIIDHILEGLTRQEMVPNKCSRPDGNNVASRGRKRCIECAAKSAQYMRTHRRRKTMNAERTGKDKYSFGTENKQCPDHTCRDVGEEISCALVSASR